MTAGKKGSIDYVTRTFDTPSGLDGAAWDALLERQASPTPFMRHAYLQAMHESGSAVPRTGWTPRLLTLWRGDTLVAGCVVYLKSHSYGEYVFDWAWASAYEQHGLDYYPKALVASPFTPVPGTRLLAIDDSARQALVRELRQWCEKQKLSSLHLLFAADEDVAACAAEGLMLRHTVQFHWTNGDWRDFDAFLGSLNQEKRKKIRQERRKVAEAGVQFRWARGDDIAAEDWEYFYRCYERTYLEHGNAPYLTRKFFAMMAAQMPANWLLFIAEREGRRIGCSLIALEPGSRTAYGRYWGATERVDCLHFEACYYQPLQWCIAQGWNSFEGGAQGEHKMARALLPVRTTSCHWLARPDFTDAVERFLEREGRSVEHYLEHLEQRSPFKRDETPPG